ncbi:farnesyl pyrophosphate synthase-like isoform X2 [Tubulanus polymorphus]
MLKSSLNLISSTRIYHQFIQHSVLSSLSTQASSEIIPPIAIRRASRRRYSTSNITTRWRDSKDGSCISKETYGVENSTERILKMDTKKSQQKQTDELKLFDDVFPQIIDDAMSIQGHTQHEIQQAMDHFKEVLLYNIPGGKKNRGLAVVSSYKYLVPSDRVTDDDLLRARILGWCVEILQAYFLVADDIMDESSTRRGKQCWYKKKGIGMIAINDSFFIDSCIYVILKKYFRGEKYYIDIVELFHETVLQTVIGQSLDLQTATSDGEVDFSRFSTERYAAIVKWKTAFYSFYLPVALAMYMAGITDAESHAKAKRILLKMGHFFQVQDDYLDCYGDPTVIGKIGTDIRDNKCSWLINEALIRASPEQIKVLEENYAQADPAKERKVKDVFDELDMKGIYARYEEDSYHELVQLIETSSGDLPKQMFVTFAEKIYKRKK